MIIYIWTRIRNLVCLALKLVRRWFADAKEGDNGPSSSPAPEVQRVDQIDPNIRKLVCENCWSTVFSPGPFRTAWIAQAQDPSTSGLGFTYLTPSWAEMQDSIEHMCEWCDVVCEEIEFWYQHRTKTRDLPPPTQRFSLTVRFMTSQSSRLLLEVAVENDWRPHFIVHAASDDLSAKYISERSAVFDMDNEAAYDLVKRCIEDCSRHEHCPLPVPAMLPTRMIDCFDPSRPRLLVTNDSTKQSYAALSYVWGEEQPHRMTTENLDSYTTFVDPSLIPVTIRDAITVTHKLGLRYLWVDALCIIQNSREDKIREIPKIHSNFRNAFITIVAAKAVKASAGFLRNDLTRWYPQTTPSTLPFIAPCGSIGTMLLTKGGRLEPDVIDTRAWCLEERVLSPRVVVYSSQALQYECQARRMNVNGSHNFLPTPSDQPRLPDYAFAPGLLESNSMPTEKQKSASWRDMLGQYSRRGLTKPRDRLVALGALAKQFHLLWPESEYAAGLWTHHLPKALLWYTTSDPNRNPSARPTNYRAPSWSWAAVDGGISGAGYRNSRSIMCNVLQVEVVLKNSTDLYGEVTSGFLILDCILRMVIWNAPEGDLFECNGGSTTVALTSHPESDKGEIGVVVADATEEVSAATCQVTAAIVQNTGTSLLGLVLVTVPELDDTYKVAKYDYEAVYKRVGWFTAPFCDRDRWLSTPRSSVKII